MDDTWGHRDLPVLDAIVALSENDDWVADVSIEKKTGFDTATVQKALRALANNYPPYFATANMTASGRIELLHQITGDARRAVGAWPTAESLADALIERLQQLANDEEADPDTRERAKQGLRAFVGVGKDVLVGVASSALSAGLLG